MTSNKMNKTIQEQHRKFYYISALAACDPPGFEELFKNRFIVMAIKANATFCVLVSYIYTIATFSYIFLSNDPLSLKTLQLRRFVGILPGTLKLAAHMTNKRKEKLRQLFKTMNGFLKSKETQECFQGNMKITWKMIKIALIGVSLNQPPMMLALLGPLFRNKQTLTKYTVNCGTMYLFAFGYFAYIAYNGFLLIVLTVAISQLQVLRHKLKTIFNRVRFDENNKFWIKDHYGYEVSMSSQRLKNDVIRVRKEIGRWVDQHHETLKWLEEVKAYFRYTSTAKFIGFGSYVCLAVWSTPLLLKNGKIADVTLIWIFLMTSAILSYYESRMGDMLRETSESLFDEAYDTMWCLYPPDITKSLAIIASYSKFYPVKLRVLGIMDDNSKTFLAVINTAYKALSFLLNMEI